MVVSVVQWLERWTIMSLGVDALVWIQFIHNFLQYACMMYDRKQKMILLFLFMMITIYYDDYKIEFIMKLFIMVIIISYFYFQTSIRWQK